MHLTAAQLLTAVADAQRAGAKQRRERVASFPAPARDAPPLRWVEVEDPAVVYLPDVRTDRAGRRLAATLLLVGTGVVALLAILAFNGGRPWWGGGLLAGTVGLLALAHLAEERAVGREQAAEQDVEREGLYLTPERMLIVTRRGIREVVRPHVVAAGPRRHSAGNRAEHGSELRLSLRVDDGTGSAQLVDLLHGDDPHVTSIVQAWHAGHWPLPLPRRP